MSEYEWQILCERAIQLFGTTPMAQLEHDIVQQFKDSPLRVAAEIESIGKSLAAGKPIESPWAVLRSRLKQPRLQAVATVASEEAKKVKGAENWIGNAGLYCDRWHDVEDELFNPMTGMLREHDSPELRDRMRQHWEEQRPRGERAEAESEAYMAKVKADRERIVAAIEARWPETDSEQRNGPP